MTWQTDVAARTLVQEVRGEPLEGQIAVAWVLKNRLADGRWGKTLSSVCLWHAAFSGWWCPRQADGKPYYDPNFAYACGLQDDDPMVEHMLEILAEVLPADPAIDPTDGATHYCNLDVVSPPWAQGATQTVKIGRHTFFKNVK